MENTLFMFCFPVAFSFAAFIVEHLHENRLFVFFKSSSVPAVDCLPRSHRSAVDLRRAFHIESPPRTPSN